MMEGAQPEGAPSWPPRKASRAPTIHTRLVSNPRLAPTVPIAGPGTPSRSRTEGPAHASTWNASTAVSCSNTPAAAR